MRLYLVRHGESVDNVAGLYAGARDSSLTTHGMLQVRRLGAHLAAADDGGIITHIFSSDLQRASATAAAILDALPDDETDRDGKRDGGVDRPGSPAHAVAVVKVADLRERDFRSAEGMRFGRSSGSSAGVSDGDGTGSRNAAFADAESREAMRVRADRFVETHLSPLLHADAAERRPVDVVVVVVAHGIILNVLLSSLLQRFAPAELARLAAKTAVARPSESQRSRQGELSVPWSNTGYLALTVDGTQGGGDEADAEVGTAPALARGFRVRVTAVNCTDHLQGLKRTRGGIGSAAFDAKQRTMDAFFGPAAKRQKKAGDGTA
ncbi:Histidine phosphatase superfamily, clade-1 [Niveomyces insectorum RCEF 264]|uniref:Histidine phosphatase superfamily, clade-1 n=1 Tax=Niveomyces insectorum RCEF 264 TaxID=1081102 RepID=A0A167QBT6_9HYPO|nr:Histidine phosphatase superfamily, clade-1 [Niveomyces insectorum RCEF 264]